MLAWLWESLIVCRDAFRVGRAGRDGTFENSNLIVNVRMWMRGRWLVAFCAIPRLVFQWEFLVLWALTIVSQSVAEAEVSSEHLHKLNKINFEPTDVAIPSQEQAVVKWPGLITHSGRIHGAVCKVPDTPALPCYGPWKVIREFSPHSSLSRKARGDWSLEASIKVGRFTDQLKLWHTFLIFHSSQSFKQLGLSKETHNTYKGHHDTHSQACCCHLWSHRLR